MNELLNEAIVEMVNDNMLNVHKVKGLIYIKEFIDRIASSNYIEENAVKELHNKYGVTPNIVTWGDYFQTEMASSLMILSDNEFDRAIDTVRFDMIASYIIFSEKESSFFEWVESTYLEINGQIKSELSDEEEEIIHLKILMDYYNNLGIINNFTEEELRWYSMYEEAQVV